MEELSALDKRIREQRSTWNEQQSELRNRIAALKDQLHQCLLQEGNDETSNYPEVERQLKIAEAQLAEIQRSIAPIEAEWAEQQAELLEAAIKEASVFVDGECIKEKERIEKALFALKEQYHEHLRELGRVYEAARIKHEERESLLMRKDPSHQRQRSGMHNRFEFRSWAEYLIEEPRDADKYFKEGIQAMRG
ncbi:hypothetical protein [Paenibacillus validus]|uniref:Uncharacterized protein n=1 Tax=Paenibacillus validus TaxID=44253 RepID=A0A7X3CUH7_9BACL|nr:hypothetical protein [Paenibacillus validus]MUG72731.1 hypothetical protein [Paenibacillus validus]